MKTNTRLAVILIAVGIFAFAYHAINFKSKEEAVSSDASTTKPGKLLRLSDFDGATIKARLVYA